MTKVEKTVLAVILLLVIAWLFLIGAAARQIDVNGGLGVSIGKFINDIKQQIK